MSGMYNMIFGKNPQTENLMYALGMKPSDIPRLRDAFVSEGKIVVYCRMGEPNRSCWVDSATGTNREDCTCNGCRMVFQIPKNKHFIRWQDDSFDNTYTSLFYNIPDEHKAEFASYDIGEWSPDKVWASAIDSIKEGNISPAMREFGERLQKAISASEQNIIVKDRD